MTSDIDSDRIADEHGEVMDPDGDLLKGIPRIAKFIDESVRRTYYLAAEGQIPAGKVGRLWIASKRRLREHYRRLTDGSAV